MIGAMRKSTILVLSVLPVLLFACSSGNGSSNPTPKPDGSNELEVGMQEFAYVVNGTAKAGPLTLDFHNVGKQEHMAIVGRLDPGKTLADVRKAFTKDSGGPPPKWYHDDPADESVLSPGQSVGVTIDASTPGTYVMLCFFPDPKTHKPHVALGMAQTFEVSKQQTTAPRLKPAAGFSISDSGVRAPDLQAGKVTVNVSNRASKAADFNVVQLAPGKTPADADRWFNSGQKGPRPVELMGGTHAVEPGSSILLTFDLKPGTYTAVSTIGKKDLTATFKVT
ncbi:MAG: hypothetical protein ABR600_06155 [Actinomycetota bacterium]